MMVHIYTVLFKLGGGGMVSDAKVAIKTIVEKLTANTKSVFSDKVFTLAADLGIGEMLVQDSIKQLVDENFIREPVMGVLQRV